MMKRSSVWKKGLALLMSVCMTITAAAFGTASTLAAELEEPLGTIAEVVPAPNLAQMIAEIMGRTVEDPVTASELESMPELNGNNREIYSLEGMQYVKRAVSAYFMGNHITDLRPVKDLTVSTPRGIRFTFQTVEYEPVQLKNGRVSVKNPFVDKTLLPTYGLISDITDGGIYNIFTNSVDFYGLSGEGSVSYLVNGYYTNVGPFYSCTVTQPYYE